MGHDGPGFPPVEHLGWGIVHFVVPLVLFLVVIGVVVWAVLYLTSHRSPEVASVGGPPPRDAAMEELRIRYARGEFAREEFVQRSVDLGGPPPAADPPAVGPEPAAEEPPTTAPPDGG